MVEKKLEDIRVSQVKFSTDLADETRRALSAEVDRKVTAVQTEMMQYVNQTRQYLQETLRELKEEVIMVSQSQ